MRKAAYSGIALAALCALLGCRAKRPAPENVPEPPGFPLARAAVLPVEGDVNPPLMVRQGVLYYSQSNGKVSAVDVSDRRVLWTFGCENPVAVPPEPGGGSVLVRDEKNILYALDPSGGLLFKAALGEPGGEAPSTAVRGAADRIFYGTESGLVVAAQASAPAAKAWEYRAGAPVRSGPVFAGSLVLFGLDSGRLLAFHLDGRLAWSFQAQGPIAIDPAVGPRLIHVGTQDRYLYALASDTGMKRWGFRLGGPASRIVPTGTGALFVAASNGVLYGLSERAGDIRWWKPLASRLPYPPVVVDGSVLASYPGPDILGLGARTGDLAGSALAQGELLTGLCPAGSFLAFVEKGPPGTKNRLVFLERDVELLLAADPEPPRAPRRPVEFKATAVGFDDPRFEFFVVEGVVRVRRQGPSRKSSWVWIPRSPGEHTVIVRASDRAKSRETVLTYVIEKPGDTL